MAWRDLRGAALALAAAAGIGLGAARPAEAAFTFTIKEVGNDVVVTGSGTLNLDGLTKLATNTLDTNILWPAFVYVARIDGDHDVYSGVTGPTELGLGNFAFASVASGDTAGLYQGGLELIVPKDYVSGTPLSNSMTFENKTLETLGIVPGTFVFSWGEAPRGDTLTINVVAPVPEPTTALLFGAGLLGLAVARRRRD